MRWRLRRSPPSESTAASNGRPSTGALRSLRASNTSAWLVSWNVIGQPAVAVPVGLDDDGMPTAVQLTGRPSDEATLLRLAAEIEAHRPPPRWAVRPGTA